MLSCTDTLELVYKTLHDHSAVTLDSETCVIKMPSRLSDGNLISIFVREIPANSFIVHDNAITLSALTQQDVDVFDERAKHRWLAFNSICNEFSIVADGWVLTRHANADDVGDAVADLTSAIQGIYDLRFSTQKKAQKEENFKKLVEEKLKTERVIYWLSTRGG